MLQAGPLLSSLSPSFNTTTTAATGSYSSSSAAAGNLADIAARVVSELRRENPDAATAFLFDDDDQPWLRRNIPDEEDGDGDESEFEFEFAVSASPISADEIFLNGQIKPLYPLFGKPLLDLEETAETGGNDKTTPPLKSSSQSPPPPPPPPRRRQPLRKLMVEDRDWPPSTSCSSSEADELDGLGPGTYCVWAPNGSRTKTAADRKKSRSTGTAAGSRRWKLRDLILNRSSSDAGPGPRPRPEDEAGPKKGGKAAVSEEEKKKPVQAGQPCRVSCQCQRSK